MHSAKAVKDIRHNLHEFEQSGDSAIHQYAQGFRDAMQDFLRDLYALREDRGEDERTAIVSFEELAAAMQRIEKRHSAFHERIYADVRCDRIAESRVSSLLNVNRELLTANRCLLLALGCYYLNAQQQENLEHLPF